MATRNSSEIDRDILDLVHNHFIQSKIRCFPHRYQGSVNCNTYEIGHGLSNTSFVPFENCGISGIAFDKEGRRLVYVTRLGCVTVYNFDYLYHNQSPGSEESVNNLLLHHNPNRDPFVAVKWNPFNEQQVGCVNPNKHEVACYDLEHIQDGSLPGAGVQIFHPYRRGLWFPTDVVFTSNDPNRVYASDTNACINIWDIRHGALPCRSIEWPECYSSPRYNSITLSPDDQVLYASGSDGVVRAWDTRNYAVQFASIDLKVLVRAIPRFEGYEHRLENSCPVRDKFFSVHNISFNPSCSYQLAFHLEMGCSGTLDVNNSSISHLHFPPMPKNPAAHFHSDIDFSNNGMLLDVRKPCWLSMSSIYMVPTPVHSGIHLMDFSPGPHCPCHIDFVVDPERRVNRRGVKRRSASKFIALPDKCTTVCCAGSPSYDMIVAGTKQNKLVVIPGGVRGSLKI